jgi:hypothetical protein
MVVVRDVPAKAGTYLRNKNKSNSLVEGEVGTLLAALGNSLRARSGN